MKEILKKGKEKQILKFICKVCSAEWQTDEWIVDWYSKEDLHIKIICPHCFSDIVYCRDKKECYK